MNEATNGAFTAVTIIVVTSNEVESLKRTVEGVLETCMAQDIDKILLIYPDFVTAGCLEMIEWLCQAYAHVPVLSCMQQKPGVGNALREGIEMSCSSHTLLVDSDGSRDLCAVSQLIEKAKKNPGKVCKTSRWLRKGSFHGYGRLNLAANLLAQLFLKALYGRKSTDMTDAMQLVPTSVYRSIDWRETDFAFFLEMVLAPMRLGCEYVEIPVSCFGRTEGVSRNSFAKKAGYLACALRLRFTPKRRLRKQ